MKLPLIIPLFLTLAAGSLPAQEFDLAQGKQLVDNHCYDCHGTEYYTRKERRVDSRQKLSAQVRFCEQSQNLTWFDEDVENVAEYLNQNFYHFGR
jgi:mono/diheme cytochrome c family protein